MDDEKINVCTKFSLEDSPSRCNIIVVIISILTSTFGYFYRIYTGDHPNPGNLIYGV